MRQLHEGSERVLARGGLTDIAPTGRWSKACREKSAEVLDGYYYPVSKAFDFNWKGEGAMLWIGDNGRHSIPKRGRCRFAAGLGENGGHCHFGSQQKL